MPRNYARSASATAAATLGAMAARDAYRYGKSLVSKAKGNPRRRSTYTKVPRPFSNGGMVLTAPKRFQTTIAGASRSGHSLNEEHLTALIQSTTLDDRERQQVYVTKINVCGWMSTISKANAAVIGVRCALLQTRYSDFATFSMDNDFFVGFGNTSTTTFSSHSSGLQTLTLPINRRKFDVLAEFNMKLAESGGYKDDQPTSTFFNKTVPINRRVTFNDTTTGSVENPIYFVWWYEYPDHSAAGPTAAAIVQDRWIHRLYFHDIL